MKSQRTVELSDYIESVFVAKTEQVAVLFPECHISYVESKERTGYQGLYISWKKSKQIKFKGFFD